MSPWAGRAFLALRYLTRLSPRVRGLGKIIPPLMAATSGLPESLRAAVVSDVDGDLRMELRLDDLIQGYIFWNPSGYEKHTLDVIKQWVKPGDTVLDLGANVGFYSLVAARLVGAGGRVIAVEPDPENYAQLCRNIALNRIETITPVNKAVAERPGRLRLSLDRAGNRGAHTLLPPESSCEWVEVEVDTVDGILAGLGIERVDFLKVDVEGFEDRALRGAALEGHPIIVTEVFDDLLQRAGSSRERYIAMLRERGYRVQPIERDALNYLCLPAVSG